MWAVLFPLLLSGLTPRPGLPELVERILAVVDGRPLTLSEVRLLARIRGEDEKAALQALIDERLMFREASRLSQAQVTKEEEARALSALQQRLGGGELEPVEELRRLVRRQLSIIKYIEFRFRPQVRVEDEAVRRAYDAGYANQVDAPPFLAVEEDIRDRLAEKELTARIEAWVKGLRSQAEIRENH